MLLSALGLELTSSGFLDGVLGTGTATPSTDLGLALILIIELEAIAALAVWAHNLRNSKRPRLFGTRSKAATKLPE